MQSKARFSIAFPATSTGKLQFPTSACKVNILGWSPLPNYQRDTLDLATLILTLHTQYESLWVAGKFTLFQNLNTRFRPINYLLLPVKIKSKGHNLFPTNQLGRWLVIKRIHPTLFCPCDNTPLLTCLNSSFINVRLGS